jgi:hypothetical protein
MGISCSLLRQTAAVIKGAHSNTSAEASDTSDLKPRRKAGEKQSRAKRVSVYGLKIPPGSIHLSYN